MRPYLSLLSIYENKGYNENFIVSRKRQFGLFGLWQGMYKNDFFEKEVKNFLFLLVKGSGTSEKRKEEEERSHFHGKIKVSILPISSSLNFVLISL